LQHVEINEKYCKIAVAPFISDFNEELKEETSKKSRLYGEALADVYIMIYFREIIL